MVLEAFARLALFDDRVYCQTISGCPVKLLPLPYMLYLFYDFLVSLQLELKEYGTDNEDDYNGYFGDEELLADKLKDSCEEHVDDLELEEDYKVPADLLHRNGGPKSKELLDSAVDVIRRCSEYGKKYENESGDEVEVVFEESSEESEQWDCETIVTTYSNLDNHPGKIDAPMVAGKKKLAEAVTGALNVTDHAISLRGKEKLPVEFLPHRRAGFEKVKDTSISKVEPPKRKQHGLESKDEKKERKVKCGVIIIF